MGNHKELPDFWLGLPVEAGVLFIAIAGISLARPWRV